MRLWGTLLAIAMLVGCASAPVTPATTGTARPRAYVTAGVVIDPLPPRTAGGPPTLHARAMLLDASGAQIDMLDLGEVFADGTDCLVADAPSIAEHALSVTFACSGLLPRYRVAIVDRRNHVAVWTFLADDGAGNWAMMGEMYIPPGTSVRLLSEPIAHRD